MTIDEAIKHAEEVAEEQEELYRLCPASESRCDGTKDYIAVRNGKNKGCQKCAEEHRQLAEWLKDYKRLKEQEPCEDAISRQAVNNLQKYRYNCGDTAITCISLNSINELPTVTPQSNTGKWLPIEYDGYADGSPVWDKWECSECGYEHNGDEESLTAFCPDCGRKMEV